MKDSDGECTKCGSICWDDDGQVQWCQTCGGSA